MDVVSDAAVLDGVESTFAERGVSHTAMSDIAKYAGKYDAGWKQVRQTRWRKQKSLGLCGQQNGG